MSNEKQRFLCTDLMRLQGDFDDDFEEVEQMPVEPANPFNLVFGHASDVPRRKLSRQGSVTDESGFEVEVDPGCELDHLASKSTDELNLSYFATTFEMFHDVKNSALPVHGSGDVHLTAGSHVELSHKELSPVIDRQTVEDVVSEKLVSLSSVGVPNSSRAEHIDEDDPALEGPKPVLRRNVEVGAFLPQDNLGVKQITPDLFGAQGLQVDSLGGRGFAKLGSFDQSFGASWTGVAGSEEIGRSSMTLTLVEHRLISMFQGDCDVVVTGLNSINEGYVESPEKITGVENPAVYNEVLHLHRTWIETERGGGDREGREGTVVQDQSGQFPHSVSLGSRIKEAADVWDAVKVAGDDQEVEQDEEDEDEIVAKKRVLEFADWDDVSSLFAVVHEFEAN